MKAFTKSLKFINKITLYLMFYYAMFMNFSLSISIIGNEYKVLLKTLIKNCFAFSEKSSGKLLKNLSQGFHNKLKNQINNRFFFCHLKTNGICCVLLISIFMEVFKDFSLTILKIIFLCMMGNII